MHAQNATATLLLVQSPKYIASVWLAALSCLISTSHWPCFSSLCHTFIQVKNCCAALIMKWLPLRDDVLKKNVMDSYLHLKNQEPQS